MNNNDTIWSSVEELNGEVKASETQEFFELPIINEVANSSVEEDAPVSNRRDFLKHLGFGLGAATLAASCKSPIKKAIPYVTKPDAIVPGVATYYASSFVKGGDWCSVLVKTRDGRPIKVEGNKLSSLTQGGTSARAQAFVLDLYDTNRITSAAKVFNGSLSPMKWADLDKTLSSSLTANSTIRIVTNTVLSPSTKAVFADFIAKYPNTKVVTYDPVSSSALLDANEATFGQRIVPSYHFDKAETIVSFGADFLGTWISPVEYAADYAKGRKIEHVDSHAKMSRHYQVESTMTMTGSNADHRVLVKPSEQGFAIATLYNKVASKLGGAPVSIGGYKFANAKVDKQLSVVAADLVKSKSKSLVVSASTNKEEQLLVNKLNALLGGYGTTITTSDFSNQRQGDDKAMASFVKEASAGRVDAVFFLDANPVYDFYLGTELASALGKVKLKVSSNAMLDETTTLCDYVAPNHNNLEAWGDAEPKNGYYSLIQPTIAPLFETRAVEETLLTLAGNTTAFGDYIQAYWKSNVAGKQSKYLSFSTLWQTALHDGILEIPGVGVELAAGDISVAASGLTKPLTTSNEVAFYETVQIGAGQYANNPWLQEMPDPVTRCVWENQLLVNIGWDGTDYQPFQGLKQGDIVNVSINGGAPMTMPVAVQFGQLAGTFAIALGYGREKGGKCGTGVGSNVLPFVTKTKDGVAYYAANVTVEKVKDAARAKRDSACVQLHHTMGVTGSDEANGGAEINVDEKVLGFQGALTKRSIIRTTNLPHLEHDVHELEHEREHHQKLNSYTLYKKPDSEAADDDHGHGAHGHDAHGAHEEGVKDQQKQLEGSYKTMHKDLFAMGHHWGMNVDLSTCTGCGSCEIACKAENNVPVVGKYEVSRRHEMTWIRIDRYFYGDVENPNTVYQPMMCQHCDNAPCENVCPVAATNHSSEGLNQMTYNRCIGTRYCANNCPYKVRRLNWLDYTTADLFPWNENKINGEDVPYYANDLVRMVLNPDVTVRSRGVIEKCSFCVQRLQEAKLKAKVEGRSLKDGEANTACATACPSQAITFGDMNDHNSEVFKKNNDPRNYKVLEEVNTQSSVGYLMKVTNKNEKFEA